MSPEQAIGSDAADEPLPAPIPGREFNRLNRRQSIIAWAIGSFAGIALAVGALLVRTAAVLSGRPARRPAPPYFAS